MTTAIDTLLQKHEVLFKDELGTMKNIQVRLCVKPDAVPKFCRARSAPYALRPVIEKDLIHLEKMGAIEKVKYSDWAILLLFLSLNQMAQYECAVILR